MGSALFIAGGFTLPYIVVSSMAFVMAVVLALVVPKVTMDDKSDTDKQTKSVTFAAIAKVSTFSKLPWDVKLMKMFVRMKGRSSVLQDGLFRGFLFLHF